MSLQEYGSLREKIAAEKAARTDRYAEFEALYAKAHYAGLAAGEAAKPRAMVVTEEYPEEGRSWFVSEGVCGFAWVVVRPATSSFAKWARREKSAKAAYGGGLSIWVREFGQSMARKEAYAEAFAATLRGAGIEAHASSRMD